MLSYYCFKGRQNTESKNPKMSREKNRLITLLSKCAVCDRKKSKFIKDQEASELLSSLRIMPSFNEITLLGSLLFK